MAYEIVMPQLGLTMTEGSVNTWAKQPGEHVQKGEILFTVSTDKVDMDVESTGSGFLNTVIDVGKTVPVGTVIAVLTTEPGEKVNSPAPVHVNGQAVSQVEHAMPAPVASSDSAPSQVVRSFPASPRARSLAKNLGIDIAEVTPESGNRVVEADVKKFAEARQQAKPATTSSTRRITAERTSQSFERAPHFYLGREVNAASLARLRESLKGTAQRRLGFNVTYTDFLLRALALALRDEPAVNSYWKDEGVCRRDTVDVGLAVQSDRGLLVPVIPGADRLSLFDIAARRKDLSERARDGKVTVDEMQGGSATLSNLGAYGVDWFQAILNPPQSIILAVGEIAPRPTVIDGRLEVADTLILCLSADHRVLDGVAAARFLATVARMIADPFEILV